ncbi:MAG: zinc-ribbon domain-containing protein [Candidatus Acidiferrales bacterium]
MAHCTKCGNAVSDGAGFCPACGAPQAGGAAGGAQAPPVAAGNSGLSENAAAGLSYLLGWVTGLIFLIIDKRPSVQFHARQSIVVFGGLHILTILMGVFFGLSLMAGGWMAVSPGFLLFHLVQLVTLILWILCLIKGFQGERFRVPLAADLADKLFGKA